MVGLFVGMGVGGLRSFGFLDMGEASELVEKYKLVPGVGKVSDDFVLMVVVFSIVRYSGAEDGHRVKHVYWAWRPKWVGFCIKEHLMGKEPHVNPGVDSLESTVDFGFKGEDYRFLEGNDM